MNQSNLTKEDFEYIAEIYSLDIPIRKIHERVDFFIGYKNTWNKYILKPVTLKNTYEIAKYHDENTFETIIRVKNTRQNSITKCKISEGFSKIHALTLNDLIERYVKTTIKKDQQFNATWAD